MKFQLMILAVAVFAVCYSAPSEDDEWKNFKTKHGKAYKSSSDEARRRKNWKNNKAAIDKHNTEADAGLHSYKKGPNHLTDMTEEEFMKTLTETGTPAMPAPSTMRLLDRQTTTYPASLNWTSSSCMPPVKDQGQCGCCYAFAATGVLEFLNCAKHNVLTILSEQQIVDCSTAYNNAGCDGGLALNSFSYVIKSSVGQVTNAAYPFTGVQGTCKSVASVANSANADMTSWGYVTQSGDEVAMVAALNKYGPLAVSIYATANLQSYSSGVFKDTTCPSSVTNHAVILVGYGTTSTGTPYWIIRNSWSTLWGERGYVRFFRGSNMCSVGNRVVYAVPV